MGVLGAGRSQDIRRLVRKARVAVETLRWRVPAGLCGEPWGRPAHQDVSLMNARGLHIDLSGRTALVTGASGELGRVIAKTLGASGADVIVHYHSQRKHAQQVAQELVTMGRRAMVVQGDIGSLDSVLAMRAAIERGIGLPSIVVANAVQQYGWQSILEQPMEDFDGQYRTCVVQAVALAKAFVPAMIDGGWGRFIGMSTECAMLARAGTGAYVAGKRGMDGIFRVLARELGPHQITVNQVAPGWTISDRVREDGSSSQPGYEAGVPLRRRGDDIEVARVIAFLASDLGAFITGLYLPVCGGSVMPTI